MAFQCLYPEQYEAMKSHDQTVKYVVKDCEMWGKLFQNHIYHQSKINKEISNLCDIPEDLNHYLFGCKKFDAERVQLQEKVEEILHK